MRILIAGCGYVGSILASTLSREGHAVWGLGRALMNLPKRVDALYADVTQADSLTSLPTALDAVVYAIGAGAYDEERYRAIYVDGVSNLLSALQRQPIPPTRFVYVSSTGVYAQDGGEWVDEDSPAEQTHFSGAALLAGERIVADSRISSVVVRLGGIYGPNRTRLIDSVRDGSATVASNPSYINLIHRDDCAGIIQHVLQLAKPQPLYLGVDNEPTDRRIILEWIADRMGVAPPQTTDILPSPRAARGNKRCKNARITSAGYKFRYPTYREGYEELIRSTLS